MAATHSPDAFGHVLDQRNIWELFNSLFGDPVELGTAARSSCSATPST